MSDNGKEEQKEAPPSEPATDFKVAEIWIKSGQVYLEASKSFWDDKCRAVGLLMYCIDIVKESYFQKDKNKIVPATGQIMNFIRGGFKKRK